MNRLRLGRHHKDLVYVQDGPEPSNDDRRLGVFSTERDAVMVVQWGNFFAGALALSEYEEDNPTAFREALTFWTEKLARLDAAIANGQRARHLGVRHIAEHLRTERRHLAMLLWKLGVDVPDLPETLTEEETTS